MNLVSFVDQVGNEYQTNPEFVDAIKALPNGGSGVMLQTGDTIELNMKALDIARELGLHDMIMAEGVNKYGVLINPRGIVLVYDSSVGGSARTSIRLRGETITVSGKPFSK